ncbi:MAG TPA: lytic transglycosylase domain-containing protein, partial [Candidatus Binatus sp.]|nr:lytic transglycosylase domain-containing protein [Candidatus Binatus sp.]
MSHGSVLLSLLLASSPPAMATAQEPPFAIPAGLEGAVEFWQQVFSRYGFAEVLIFDPVDPATVYSVVRAPENDQGRALIGKERARIATEYEIADDEGRIKSQRGAREQFVEGLKLSGRYIAQMQKIFREEGLPAELAYLPLVESSFNVRARSGVGAVGMWQFMPETGKKFMRIDAAVDERRDPMSSTRAAARLLKQNYQILRNWPLAITAYNHGTDGIFRGIKAVESDNLVDLIRRYQSPTFGFASKNFYAEFLAVVEIATNSEHYFPYLRQHRPMVLEDAALTRQTSLSAILKPAAISSRDFFEWNPALEPGTRVVPSGYRVKLPADKVETFLAMRHQDANAGTGRKSLGAGHGSGKAAPAAVAKKRPSNLIVVHSSANRANK